MTCKIRITDIVHIALLLLHSVANSNQQKITSISVSPKKLFPIELGQSVTLQITPDSGSDYDDATISFELGNKKAYRIYRSECTGPLDSSFVCKYNPLNVIYVTYTPLAEHYGLELVMKFFPDPASLWEANLAPIFKEKVELTKQPSYVNMFMRLTETSRHIQHIPTNLRLDPPVFLTGSHVHIDCHSDGALPPRAMTFTVECPPPNTAVVEEDRVNQASQGLSYERYYQTYGFYSPPTLADLAPYVGRKNADELLRQGHVYRTNDTSIRAVLSMTSKAHDCHVVCRLAGKETRRRLTVYHPTTIAYLLPRPRNLQMEVGGEITCYADGHPPPTLSLRLSQPLKPPEAFTAAELEALRKVGRLPEKINGDLTSKELILTDAGLDLLPEERRGSSAGDPNAGRHRDTDGRQIAQSRILHQSPGDGRERWLPGAEREPYERTDRIPGAGLFTVDRDRMLGIKPWEYTIQGATFRLADNATPGVELLLTCKARNVLPGDTTFLNMNGTIARARFVVIARSRASIGISLGVCAAILLLVLIIVAVMLSQKRRQTATAGGGGGTSNAALAAGYRDTRAGGGTGVVNGKSSRGYQTNKYQKGEMTTPSANHATFPDTNAPVFATIDRQMPTSMSVKDLNTSPNHMDPASIANHQYYAELSFDQRQPLVHRDRHQSLQGGGGLASTSMTLYNRGPNAVGTSAPAHMRGVSVPQGLDASSTLPCQARPAVAMPLPRASQSVDVAQGSPLHQPRAYSSQLVLQQQQEATQSLLGMQRKKPSVLV